MNMSFFSEGLCLPKSVCACRVMLSLPAMNNKSPLCLESNPKGQPDSEDTPRRKQKEIILDCHFYISF